MSSAPGSTQRALAATSTAADPATGDRILAAWERGELIPGAGGTGAEPRVRLAGLGESYAAWRLEVGGTDLIVRIPWRETGELAQPSATEIAALPHVPAGLGPRLLAAHPDPLASPVGLACLVTAHVPGHVLAPEAWTPEHLQAHARALARLHQAPLPGRGPLAPPTEADPQGTAALRRGPMSIVAELDGAFDWWREHEPTVTEHPVNAPMMARARAVCEQREWAFAGMEAFVLAHGDLCATNIVWDRAPRYIDFEWAQADDRARDVAIIGGPVRGGPWYVPMSLPQVEAFTDAYVAAARSLDPALELDVPALRARREAWEAYERTAMLLHVTRRAAAGDPEHRAALPVLRETLARRLEDLR